MISNEHEVRMGPPLTAEESRALDFILKFLARETFQPSVREICKACGHKSPKAVSDLIVSLAEKGYLEKSGSRARAIRIIGVEITISRKLTPPRGRSARRDHP